MSRARVAVLKVVSQQLSGTAAAAEFGYSRRQLHHSRDALLRDLAAVRDHGEDVRDDEDADAPGEGDPDVGADRLRSEQVADRVDDGRHRLVLGEGAYRAGHGAGGHE